MEKNFSRIENCSFWEKSYDPEPVREVYWSYMFTCVLSSLFSIPTLTLNFLVIIAIYSTTSLHTPYNIYLCSLAVSDFIIGLIAEPLYISHVIMELNGDFAAYCVTGAITAFISYTTAGASMFTLAAMSVDRYLSIEKALKYRSMVTSKRVAMVTLVLWSLSAIGSSLRLFLSVKYFFPLLSLVMLVCMITIFLANITAFRSLKIQRQRLIKRMQLHQGRNEVKLSKSRKFLVTMLYVLGLVMVAYIPFGTVTVLTVIGVTSTTTRVAWNFADPIGYMNSALNPILYCFRIPGIFSAIKTIIRRYFCIRIRSQQVMPIQFRFTNELVERKISKSLSNPKPRSSTVITTSF